jgi:hypothetical protein
MAELGAIATRRVLHRVRALPIWAATNARVVGSWPSSRSLAATFAESPNKALSGVTKENGSPVPGISLRLYHRATGELLSETVSQAGGVFSFGNLSVDAEDYYIIALKGSENAKIYDLLTPQ